VIVQYDDPTPGQTVLCPHCSAYFVVTHTTPTILDWIYKDEDDYVDEEFEDDLRYDFARQ
jgi:hypothetical protein